MLTAHEWTWTEKLRHSLELFARYAVPHFRGHTLGYREEWKRLQQRAMQGGMKLDGANRPRNLLRHADEPVASEAGLRGSGKI